MEQVFQYFPHLSEVQKNQLAQLPALYKYWNEQINVISRKDIDNLTINHILHSCSIAEYFTFEKGSTVADVGTGGGFPGIPLAILFPESTFYLIDSIAKKLKVINAVAEAIGLTNCTTIHQRIEKTPYKYNYVVSRAVTQFPKFVQLVRKKLDKPKNENNGIIYLKGGDFSDEIIDYRKKLTVTDLYDTFRLPFFETKKIIHLPTKQLLRK